MLSLAPSVGLSPADRLRERLGEGDGNRARAVTAFLLDSALSNSGLRLKPQACQALRSAVRDAFRSRDPRRVLTAFQREHGVRTTLTGLSAGVGALGVTLLFPHQGAEALRHFIPDMFEGAWMSTTPGTVALASYFGVELGAKIKAVAQLGYDALQLTSSPARRG